MNVVIRELHQPEEIAQIPRLEQAIWNDPSDTIRPGTLMALVHEGALLAGAYVPEPNATERLVGFIFGFPTDRPSEHHSHMAGVLPEFQGSQIGLLLKRYQRDWALSKGYLRVVWTFDPLRSLNAHFNLRKLGATFNRYIPNCYGTMGGINAGAPSDRAYAVWELCSPRVFQRIYAPAPAFDPRGLPQANQIEREVPVGLELSLTEKHVLVQIPENWGQILQTNPPLAQLWRTHSREVFEHYFQQGYRAVDFVRNPNRYVLERDD
jgi:predicted GNAT superfamily acetyltransferase